MNVFSTSRPQVSFASALPVSAEPIGVSELDAKSQEKPESQTVLAGLSKIELPKNKRVKKRALTSHEKMVRRLKRHSPHAAHSFDLWQVQSREGVEHLASEVNSERTGTIAVDAVVDRAEDLSDDFANASVRVPKAALKGARDGAVGGMAFAAMGWATLHWSPQKARFWGATLVIGSVLGGAALRGFWQAGYEAKRIVKSAFALKRSSIDLTKL